MWIIVLILLNGHEQVITATPKDTRRDCMRTVSKIVRLPDSNPADRYLCRRI